MVSRNLPGLITQNIILSVPYDPLGTLTSAINSSTDAVGANRAIDADSESGTFGKLKSTPNHWQDNIGDAVRGATSGSAGPNTPNGNTGYDPSLPSLANEFELDVETFRHTWQTLSTVAPLPGVSKEIGTSNDINTAQIISLNMELGMMRELISISGICWDMKNHPSSTSGHHIRRQQLLDIGRTQWANAHTHNRVTGFDWNDPNRFPALTIGPKHGMGGVAQVDDSDLSYHGDEPANDIRGSEIQGSGGMRTPRGPTTSDMGAYYWDHELTYKGRRRYRGVIRRLNFTAIGGQPNIWRYTFDFEVIKNELEQRKLLDHANDTNKEDKDGSNPTADEKSEVPFNGLDNPANAAFFTGIDQIR